MFDAILCGAGKMGRHHLRVMREHPAFRVVSIVDTALAGGTLDGIPVVDRVTVSADVAIVATPTVTHLPIVVELIDRGHHVLVEKPLANSVAACESIRARAAARGAIVAIGHTERFNPAVRALYDALPSIGAIRHLSFVRGGGGRRCDVLLELAVHDLDLLEQLAGRATLRSGHVQGDDLIVAADLELVTETGAVATVHVDCAPTPRLRAITVDGEHGVLRADLLAMTCASWPVPEVEPLRAQLDAFAALLAGESSEICRLDEAIRSVELAVAARSVGRRTGLAEGAR
jgi:UDP-N-acetylglucosamine 3-dehydrogenase